MKVTFEALRPTPPAKSLHAIWVDGVKVGAVSHKKVDMISKHMRMPRHGPLVEVRRRTRPLVWVAIGSKGRKEVRVVRRTRQAAVDGLLQELGLT